MNLYDFGWNDYFKDKFRQLNRPDLAPCRVIQQHRNLYKLVSESGELDGEVSGKMRHRAINRSDFPTVGDWVAADVRTNEARATISALLPRKGGFSRKVAGVTTEEQMLAANIDIVFLVMGLDGNFNIRRLERYLTLTWDSGASPVVVLNKADLCDSAEDKIAEVESAAFGIPVFAISARDNVGLEALREHLRGGKTTVFLGSSGVGKSTIINALLGFERQRVQEVSEEGDRGRHTTTYREMILIPNSGGILIDTPGLREIRLWAQQEDVEKTFEDVESLAEECKFRDCTHSGEPGCAILAALEDGSLDPGRWQSYKKLQREIKYLAQNRNIKEKRHHERQWAKKIKQYNKEIKKFRRKTGRI